MALYLFLFFLLIVIGIKYEGQHKYMENPLSYGRTLSIRGICAIEIMIGHIGVATNNKWLFANRKAGILIVGVFFLLSGYGLMFSLINKKDYLKGFIIKRAGAVLLPAYIMYVISLLKRVVLLKESVDLAYVIKYLLLLYMPTRANWYITEILVMYLLFYL